jgi:hypothetical protein
MEKNKKQKTEVIEMDSIPEIELPKIDVKQYIGTKAKIVKADVVKTQFGRAIKFETEVIAKEGTKENPIEIKATKMIGLQVDENGVYGIAKGTKAKEFFEVYNIKSHKEMIGKTVTIQATEEKNGVQFLTFI